MTSLAVRTRFLVYRAKSAGFRGPPRWRRAANGAEMWLDPADGTDLAFVQGNFAHELRRHIRAHLRPGGIAVDAGAQKGFISLAMAQAVGPAGRVYAFEPDPRSNALLHRNLGRNGAAQARPFDCALSDRVGEAEFLLSTQLGWSSLVPGPGLDGARLANRIRVQTLPFDDVAASLGLDRLDFVKIDTEGGEPAVLRGMAKTLDRLAPDVWIEVADPALRAAGSSADELSDILLGHGYRLYRPRLRRRWQIPLGVTYEPLERLPIQRGDYDALAVRAGSRTEAQLRAA